MIILGGGSGSFHFLLDLPAIPRVLKVLLAGQTGTREDSVIEHLRERAYTNKAIEMLVGQGIIRKENGLLFIVEGEENSRRVSGIMRFYEDVDRLVRRRLLFRGILNATQYAYLVHFETFTTLMETDGFSRDDVDAVLDEESREGYVERLKVMYRAREGLGHRCFPFIPLYHYPHFIMMKPDDTGHLRERLKETGVVMAEEEYLLGRYPKEIARLSRDYVLTEKEHIREKIRSEGFDAWWFYRFYRDRRPGEFRSRLCRAIHRNSLRPQKRRCRTVPRHTRLTSGATPPASCTPIFSLY